MPVWGWGLLIACGCIVIVAALAAVVRVAHRMPHGPHHGHPEDLGAPMSREAAEMMDLKPETDGDRRTTEVH